ncbi:MAG TPA: M20/M25/M40 family metallo-hydrolase [Thermoanaerobaculia bacterium]|nr:M20/M25/M40 family metallo-hydrolase [Thermoanaerobaculia bacterium]
MNRSVILSAAVLVSACATVPGTAPSPSPGQVAKVERILESPAVREAFSYVEAHRGDILDEWRFLTEIEAPSGREAERAAAVARILRQSPSVEVSVDEVGNVIAIRRGTGGGPAVAVDTHLDTVFHDLDRVETRVEEGRLWGPGVGDSTRNVEAMLAMLRALDAAGIRTRGDLMLTFTVEEETSFRGIDHLLETRGDEIDHFLALDGGWNGFTYGGVGTYWIKYHFIGPGGHTRSRTPPYSATLPAARAIDRIYRLRVPADPPSNLNVGMLGASDVFNKKAENAWFSVDVRSTDQQVLDRLDRRIAAIARQEAARAGMKLETEIADQWPAAQISGHRGSELVLTMEAVFRAMGFDPTIAPTASNHSSAALRKGISAISTGTAPCRDAHAPTENCEIEPIYRGIQRLIVMALAMTGIDS